MQATPPSYNVCETEEELIENAKKHGIEVHGYIEETWNEEIAKNKENFRKLIKQT